MHKCTNAQMHIQPLYSHSYSYSYGYGHSHGCMYICAFVHLCDWSIPTNTKTKFLCYVIKTYAKISYFLFCLKTMICREDASYYVAFVVLSTHTTKTQHTHHGQHLPLLLPLPVAICSHSSMTHMLYQMIAIGKEVKCHEPQCLGKCHECNGLHCGWGGQLQGG